MLRQVIHINYVKTKDTALRNSRYNWKGASVTSIYAYMLVSIREVFLDPEPPISCNTNIPELNQKFVVGNTVESFVEIPR